MHSDDGSEVVVIAGRPIVTVACRPDGTCDRQALSAALAADDAAEVWLSVEGSPPGEHQVAAVPVGAAAVTLAPMTDAVKQLDDERLVVATLARSTLRTVRPPALLPRRLAETALGSTSSRPLDALANADLDVVEVLR